MPPTRLYPKAAFRNIRLSGGSYVGSSWRLVLHTTETEGLPRYRGKNDKRDGAVAPHITYLPKSREWIQDNGFLIAARALFNADGGVQTNRANALQVEIVCYSDKSKADAKPGRLWVGDLPDTAYGDLAEFVHWVHSEFGIKMEWPERRALSFGEANAAGFRMSATTWNGFNGVCAHQHVPENEHWDTGALDISRILAEARNSSEDQSSRGGGLDAPQDLTIRDLTARRIVADRLTTTGQLVEEGSERGVDPDQEEACAWAISTKLLSATVTDATADTVRSTGETIQWFKARVWPAVTRLVKSTTSEMLAALETELKAYTDSKTAAVLATANEHADETAATAGLTEAEVIALIEARIPLLSGATPVPGG